MSMSTASAIMATHQSPNVSDSNFEAANVVDAIANLANGVFAIRKAITPSNAAAGSDAAGGHIESLTEAVMGITAGLFEVAAAIREHADAVRSE